MLPNKKSPQPIDSNDCIEHEKYVIVLRVEAFNPFASNWYFLSKSTDGETLDQSDIKIFDTVNQAERVLHRYRYPFTSNHDAFIHPVTVQTRVSIWGDWSYPIKSMGEVK